MNVFKMSVIYTIFIIIFIKFKIGFAGVVYQRNDGNLENYNSNKEANVALDDVSVKEDGEDGEGRTFGHLIRGGHAIVDTFFDGLLDGTFQAGNHLGHLSSVAAGAIGFPNHYPRPHIRPSKGGLYQGIGVGNPYIFANAYQHYPYGLFDRHDGLSDGLNHPGGGNMWHRPGFDGTYVSQPFTRQLDLPLDERKIQRYAPTDKSLWK